MKKISLIILLFFCSSQIAQSQEELSPLYGNYDLKKKSSLEKVGAIHSTFIYIFDTVALPFIDDFTENKFKQFNASINDPMVIDTTWFRIESGGIPFPMGTNFSLDTTFTYLYDTIPGFGIDSIVETGKVMLPSQFITVFDIDNYPVSSSIVEVWPDYNQYDSLWTGTSPDQTFFVIPTQLTQDSATVYFVQPTAQDTRILWQDDHAYHNYTYAKNPQTLGVVTFDGLNREGYPYNFLSANSKGLADVLTSKPIDMSGIIPSDSVYLSFLYQRAGYGEQPDATDSLVLEFWSPINNQWNSIWKALGGSSDNDFKIKLQGITDAQYLQNGFQFRLKSYGTLTGSLDVWHIDYVYLNSFREYDDTLMNDWAFSLPAPSLINQYTSMPWPHYEFSPNNPVKTSTNLSTYNSFINSVFIQPSSMELFFNSSLLQTVPYVITSPNVSGLSSFDMNYSIPSSFWFDTILADTCATFDITYTLGTNTLNDLTVNDTLRQQQYFGNYYSYDDGSAEGAYGLVMAGAELAYKFPMPSGLSDTLRAISMHFSPSVTDVSNELFFLQVWADNNGQPGNLIYTSDDDFFPIIFKPEYVLSNNGFYEYVLPEKLIVNGTFYVGWKQSSAQRLNIGFDKNINNQDKIFYKTSSTWSNTSFEGSLMMRPVFSSDKDYVMSLTNLQESPLFEASVYPNPASDVLNIVATQLTKGTVQIINLQGQLLFTEEMESEKLLDISMLPNGIYFARVNDTNGFHQTTKFTVLK
jgi:hypothetical protein